MTYDMRTGTYHKSNRASSISAQGHLKRSDIRITEDMNRQRADTLRWMSIITYYNATLLDSESPISIIKAA